MSKLISILMPTRNEYISLIRSLDTIKSSASDFSQVEILLRLDDDDEHRIELVDQLKDEYNIRTVVGPRVGYNGMGIMIMELLEIAEGKWSWIFDDDAWLEGTSWQDELAKIPCRTTNGPVAKCFTYQLGLSRYDGDDGPVGLIVPSDFARSFQIGYPVDEVLLSEIRRRHYKIQFLHGMTYCHDGRAR